MNPLQHRVRVSESEPAARFEPLSVWNLSALSDFALAAVFYVAWIRPNVYAPGALRMMTFTWMFELLAVAAFVGMALVTHAVGNRILRGGCFVIATAMLIFGAFMMSKLGREWAVFEAFVVLLINRAMPLLRRKRDGRAEDQFKTGAVLTVFSFALCSYLAFGLPLPSLGVTDEIAVPMRIQPPSAAKETISFGAIYYTAVGICGLITPSVANNFRGDPSSRHPLRKFLRNF